MSPRARRAVTAVLAAAALALLGAACSTTLTVSKDQVAQQISQQLTQQVGQAPDSVTCPENMEGKVGASVKCTLTAGTDTLGVTATVTAVEGTNVKYDIQVDPNVTPAPATPTP